MVTKERDEEEKFSLEMRECEEDSSNVERVHSNSDEVPLPSDTNNHRSSPASKRGSSIPPRRSRTDDFLNLENEKSDWPVTPPDSPAFPVLEVGSQRSLMGENDTPNNLSTALKPRLVNIQAESASKNNSVTKCPNQRSAPLKPSSGSNQKRSLSAGRKAASSRSATPSGRPTLATATKPSRPVTPTSRTSWPSAKAVPPAARSSTPTRGTARSTTPTPQASLSASRSTPNSAAAVCPQQTRQLNKPLALPGRSSSASKSRPEASTCPGNIKPTAPQRSASASRGRSGVTSARPSPPETGSNGKPRQKSHASQSNRLRANASRIGSSVQGMYGLHCSESDEVNPVLIGTQMVERVVNMRKLAPPRHDDLHSTNYSPAENSGFGRSLSKISLDMALRHMDISRSTRGESSPVVTDSQNSSMPRVRSGPTKSGTGKVFDHQGLAADTHDTAGKLISASLSG